MIEDMQDVNGTQIDLRYVTAVIKGDFDQVVLYVQHGQPLKLNFCADRMWSNTREMEQARDRAYSRIVDAVKAAQAVKT